VRFGLSEAQLAEIIAILQKYPEVSRGLIFGSRAMGNYGVASDIDLAIKGKDVTFKTELNISGDLEDSELPFLCDVINYNSIDHPPFKEHIDTEGVIFYRRGWQEMYLGDVASLINDKILLSYISLPTYVSTENMVANKGGIQLATSLPQIKKVNSFKRTDTLFSNIRTYFKKVWLANFSGGSSGDILIFRSKDKNFLSHEYLYYFLSSDYFIDLTVKTARGTKMPRGDKKAILGTTILVPELSFQNQVVAILCSLDDKIELNNNTGIILENMAEAIFKSWFVDFDPVHAKQLAREAGLPAARAAMAIIAALCSPHEFVENYAMMAEALTEKLASMNSTERDTLAYTASLFPDSFVDSELGKIPRGWGVSKISDEFNITMGQSPKGETYNSSGEGTPFFQGRTDFGFRFPTPRVFTTEPKRMARAGDTLISVRAPVGDKNMAIEDCCVGRGLAALRHKSGSVSYTYYLVSKIEGSLDSLAGSGTVFSSLSKDGLSGAKIIVPSREIIKKFSDLISPIDEAIATQNVMSKNLADLRDILLPELINGDLDVS